jgi:hypothetical protein
MERHAGTTGPSETRPYFVYRPGAVDPLLMMLMVLVALVTAIGIPASLLDRPEYNLIAAFGPAGAALCLSPLLVLVAIALLARPTSFEVRDEGVLLPVSRAAALLGRRRLIPYEEVRNVYVTSVEFAGAKLSPFASSAGTVLHIGIGIETVDGRTRTAKFTPSHLMMSTADPALCLEALEAIRKRVARLGRPLVLDPPDQDEATLAGSLDEARRPLLPFPVIVASFFVLPILAFAVLFITAQLGGLPEPLRWATALIAAGSPAALMFDRAWKRNSRREAAINRTAKARAWAEQTAEAPGRGEA